MERLRNKFLNAPVDAVVHQASSSAQQAATEQKDKAARALADNPADNLPRSAVQMEATTVVKAIQRELSITRRTFTAQARRRDDLVATLRRRLHEKSSLEFEKLFFRYYEKLNAEERFEFD